MLSWISSTLSLGVLLGAALASEEPQDQTGAPLVVWTYDLSALTEPTGHSAGGLDMLPLPLSSGAYYHDIETGAPPAIDRERLVGWVSKVVDPEFWATESALLDAHSEGLTVVAPQDTQSKVQAFLEFLVGASTTRERLALSVYEGSAEGLESAAAEVAQADRVLRQAVDSERLRLLRRGSLPLTDGAVQRLDQVNERSFLFDWEIEIGQGSTIADPVIRVALAGLEVRARSYPVRDGTLVQILLRHSTPLEELRESQRGASGRLLGDSGLQPTRLIGLIQLPSSGFASFAGSVVIPRGQALLIPIRVETVSGPVELLVDLRVAGDGGQRRATYELDDSLSAGLWNIGARTTALIPLCRPFPPDGFLPGIEGTIPLGDEGLNLGRIKPVSSLDQGLRTVEWLQRLFDEFGRGGPGTIETDGQRIFAVMPPAIAARVDEAVRSLTDPGRSFLIEGRITGVDGQTHAAFRLPLLHGHSTSLWSGVQSLHLQDWDVDVANESMASNPEIVSTLDGLVLSLEAREQPGNQLRLRVGGKLHFLERFPEPRDIGTGDDRKLEFLAAQSLTLDDVHVVGPGETIRIGGPELTLELVWRQ